MFVAVALPEAVREDLAAVLEPREGMPWGDPAQGHLTLAFVASVPPSRADELVERLAHAAGRVAPFALSLGGAHATALGQKYAYVSGRAYVAGETTQFAGFLLRLIDRADNSRILETNLGSIYTTLEARDVLVGGYDPVQDKERVYLLARGRGMADRELASRQAAQESMDNYVRSVATVPTSAGRNSRWAISGGSEVRLPTPRPNSTQPSANDAMPSPNASSSVPAACTRRFAAAASRRSVTARRR